MPSVHGPTAVPASTHDDVTAAAFDLAPSMMGVVEPTDDDDILHVRDNRAGSMFFGVPPGGTSGRLASALGVSPSTLQEWLRHYRASEASGEPVRFEYRHATLDGDRWLRVSVSPIGRGPSGRARFVYAAEDITEHKAAEARFRAATETMPDGFAIASAVRDDEGRIRDFRYESINDAGVRLNGHPAGTTYTGNTALQMMPGLRGTKLWDEYVRVAEHGGLLLAEDFVYGDTFGGHQRIEKAFDIRVSRIGDGIAVLWTDATERHRAREALQQERDRTRAILDTAGALIIVMHRDGTVAEFNRACEAVSGRSRDDVIGTAFWESGLIPAEHVHGARTTWNELLEGRFPNAHENDWVSVSGERRTVSWSNTAILGNGGRVEYVIATGLDVTARRHAEERLAREAVERARLIEQLKDADSRKDNFLATLAHELRNPLAPIRSAVQILQARGPADPRLVRSRDVIDRQVRHMARLLEDLLDISRISRDKLELRKERLDLRSVLEVAVETARPLLDEHHHALDVRMPAVPVFVDGDAVRLAQVFANLLNNAAKYTPEGGRVQLSLDVRGRDAVVTVRDNGIGIGEDILPQVFEMFSQSEHARVRSRGGLGIGLSLTRGLVHLHGGQVRARSDGAGQGSEFTVELPLALAAQLPADTASAGGDAAPAERTHQRVLIVDDNVDSADTLAELLELLGYETKVAYDGPSALESARQFHPTAVLLDIGLPGMSGLEVCRRLREGQAGPDLLIVAMTGWGQEEDRRQTREAGFDAHLVKPIDDDKLIRILAARRQATSPRPA